MFALPIIFKNYQVIFKHLSFNHLLNLAKSKRERRY